jgi:hypothetical protein
MCHCFKAFVRHTEQYIINHLLRYYLLLYVSHFYKHLRPYTLSRAFKKFYENVNKPVPNILIYFVFYIERVRSTSVALIIFYNALNYILTTVPFIQRTYLTSPYLLSTYLQFYLSFRHCKLGNASYIRHYLMRNCK